MDQSSPLALNVKQRISLQLQSQLNSSSLHLSIKGKAISLHKATSGYPITHYNTYLSHSTTWQGSSPSLFYQSGISPVDWFSTNLSLFYLLAQASRCEALSALRISSNKYLCIHFEGYRAYSDYTRKCTLSLSSNCNLLKSQ